MEAVSGRSCPPLLMLSEKEGSHEREFYSLSEGKISTCLELPEAAGKHCIEAGFGWLLTVANSGEVQLLNPFSRSQIQLPNFKTCFPDYSTAHGMKEPAFAFFGRAVLSANPSRTSEFTLVVTTFEYLGFWKMGDENWTKIVSMNGENDTDSIKGRKIFPADVNYSSRDCKFYAVDMAGFIYTWDPLGWGDLGVAEKIMSVDVDIACTCYDGAQSYLVESSKGESLLVVRDGSTCWSVPKRYGTSKFKVFRIDLDNKNYEEVTSLEDDAIFVGHNAAFSVSASNFPDIIKPNCVYFTDDSTRAYLLSYIDCKKCGELHSGSRDERCERNHGEEAAKMRALMKNVKRERLRKLPWVWENSGDLDAMKGGGKNMGIYDFENGTIQRFHQSLETISLECPPLWVSPPSSF